HRVRAMTRHPEAYTGAGEAVFGDVFDADSVSAAMAGVDVAYYLVHSLDADDFEDKDADAALNFGGAAAAAGVDRVIYLGGLGVEGRIFEIGGPEVLRYIDMLLRAAEVQGKRLPHVSVPLLTPSLSSAWLALVTDVDLATARNLVDSMTNEVIVRDHSIESLL